MSIGEHPYYETSRPAPMRDPGWWLTPKVTSPVKPTDAEKLDAMSRDIAALRRRIEQLEMKAALRPKPLMYGEPVILCD